MWALCAAVAILAFIPFLPAFNAGFCEFDDPAVLKDVTGYRGLTAKNFAWMFTTTHMGHYQPLTWVSYAIDHAFWGMDPRGYHLSNMLLHSVNAALVYLLARRLLAAALPGACDAPLRLETASVAAALLFALHPLRAESVAWVTERRDVLSGCFLLMAALAYLRAFPVRSVAPASTGWYLASIVLLVLSVLSKAWGMTFFVVLLVLDWFPLARLPGPWTSWLRPPTRAVLLQKIPHAVIGIATALMAARATASIPYTVMTLSDWSLGKRLVQATFGLMFYLQKQVWPAGLAGLYELPRNFNALEPRFLVAYVFVGCGAIAAFHLRGRAPALLAAALVYAVILGPILGLRQAGPQLVADRYSYLANISLVVLAAGAALAWVRRSRAPVAGAAAGVGLAAVSIVLGVLTWRQTALWRDTTALFRHGVEVADGPLARIFYGRQLATTGHKEESLVQFQKATELSPTFGEAWFSCGGALKDLDRLGEAEQAYMIAAKLMPDSWRADLMLGILYMTRMDRPHDAELRFRDAIANVESAKIQFFSAKPYLMLGAALDIQGDERGARAMLEKAAQYPETREEALEHLRAMDAPEPK